MCARRTGSRPFDIRTGCDETFGHGAQRHGGCSFAGDFHQLPRLLNVIITFKKGGRWSLTPARLRGQPTDMVNQPTGY